MQKSSNTGYAVHHLESLDGKRLMQRHELTLDDIKKAVET